MTIEDLGYNDTFGNLRIKNNLEDFEIARVIAEHKERYIVKNEKGEFEAEITGNLRFTAKSREDFPAVGDWVALINNDADFTIIHNVFPRISILSRQAVGKFGEKQIIATNIDCALLVQAVDRDLNISRLERYLTICFSSKVRPVIVLTKTDLLEPQKVREIIENINLRLKDIPVLAISNETKNGYDSIKDFIERGKTYCLLGSSGVGKSTLLNNLAGKQLMKTNAISSSTGKGKHITTHRELTVLENGGILIDNPGMREIGVTDATDGIASAFESIARYATACKFGDCTHTSEIGCAVLNALEKGEIDKTTYENFLKIERENEHFSATVHEKRRKDKSFGKIYRDVIKHRKNNKY